MTWIGTFKQEIGDDAIVEEYEQLSDGIIIMKILKVITENIPNLNNSRDDSLKSPRS